ncbi:hypothetical protein M885DRAFT_536908 [Pelagophyceae sp. CCMP2097]|nr:hypothetical protein M885DRAFT_536908 [Pelagophyceae sp. CCMP2097]|mmetsp:Transcript_22911/g.77446  ORF Transcript_22911/g.77446 Transcript_22911/m.77446 type:complete len:128 (-) Transcript_22911:109-492(-)
MSARSSGSMSKQQLTPPERGSFPLDHDGLCKPLMKHFMACLKEHSNEHLGCKALSKAYLECRMDNSLMARDKLDNLGFGEEAMSAARDSRVTNEGEREGTGFTAGMHIGERKNILPFRGPGAQRPGH